MVNTRAAPPVKVPAVIVTVNTGGVPAMAAVPAPPAPPVVKVRVPGAATASPAPLSVMTILPLKGMADAGVRDTVMMTPVALLTALLSVIAGWFTPSFEAEADVTGGGTTVAEEAGDSVAPVALVALVAFCIWVEHTNLMDADPGAGLVLLHTLLG